MKAKNIIKELIIILLSALAIILILGVLLYEYVPTNKIIPEKVSYTTPEKIKQELETDSSVDDTQIVVTYSIDSTDLNNYKRIQEYVPGKKNPFSSLNTEITNNTVENGNNSNQTNSKGTIQGNNTNQNTGYVPDKGIK